MKRVTDKEEWTYRIGHYRRLKNGKYLHHFVLMANDAIIDYDPWSLEGSRTAREGELLDYRYIFAEEG